MAMDDIFVVMYRIIAYLYRCMKLGKEPLDNEWNATAMGVTEAYWNRIVWELATRSYITGVNIIEADDALSVIIVRPRVTLEGVAFAQENSCMGRAKRFLTEIKAAVPFI